MRILPTEKDNLNQFNQETFSLTNRNWHLTNSNVAFKKKVIAIPTNKSVHLTITILCYQQK
jgi:hypothetical protein